LPNTHFGEFQESKEKALKMPATVEHTQADPTQTFLPNRVLYIQTKSIIKGETQVVDLTTHLLETYHAYSGISPEFLKEAKRIVSTPSIPDKVFTLKKGNLVGTHMTAADKDGNHIAD
jgi:hypothetical protein